MATDPTTPAVFTPADPALIDAIQNPTPTITEDRDKIAALNRQAAAMEANAQAVRAMANIDHTPYPDHEVYLRVRIAAITSGQYTQEGHAHGLAQAVLRDYKAQFPRA